MSERLTDEEYRAWIDAGSPNELEGWAIILALRAENERLREALDEIESTIETKMAFKKLMILSMRCETSDCAKSRGGVATSIPTPFGP